MVRFSDLKKSGSTGDAAPSGASPGTQQVSSGAENGDSASFHGEFDRQLSVDRDALYEDASFYLGKVFSAVKEQRRFALDPGFRIMRQVVASYLPQDTLFIKTIRIDDRLNYLINKCVNVAIYSIRLADQLGYPGEKQVEIGMAGLLHEVGMCLIPETILYKKEQLTRKEFEIIQEHSEFGYKILEPYSDDHPYLAEVALQVHERIDGSGYPQGLTGEEINEYAQIVGLVDIYEALSHSRPQRERFNHFYAIKEIIKTCKTKFRKKHLKALLNAFSIFPLSTTVRLNSNAIGRVIETYPDQPMRPRLQIEYDSQGRKVLTDRTVNLPDNPLLYIVDSVSEEEIEQLDRGVPFRKKSDAFEERDFEPPSREEPDREQGEPPEKTSPLSDDRRGRRRTGGGKPVLALLLLVLLLGAIPFREGNVRLGISSVKQTEAVQTTPEAESETKVEKKTPEPAGTTAAPMPPAAADGLSAQTTGQNRNRPSMAAFLPEKTETIHNAADMSVERPLLSIKAPEIPGPQPVSADPVEKTGPISKEAEKERSAPGRLPYSLLLSSFRSPSLTERAMGIYREKGIEPFFVRVDLGKAGVWYRVFFGHYATEKEAAAAAKSLPVREAVVKKTRYANLIEPNLSREAANRKGRQLEAFGFSPYTVRGEGTRVDLFVGAFLTQKGAEAQHAELLARGVRNRVVER